MTDEEHVFYLLRGIPRNDDWQFFLELMMDKNATATLTPDEIVIKLVEKEATIKRSVSNGSYHTKTRTVAIGPVLPPKTRHFNTTSLAPIKYLSSDHIMI
jgi:hypothetical protein